MIIGLVNKMAASSPRANVQAVASRTLGFSQVQEEKCFQQERFRKLSRLHVNRKLFFLGSSLQLERLFLLKQQQINGSWNQNGAG